MGPGFESLEVHQLNNYIFASLAQSVERRTVNPCVVGSSPSRGAKQNPLSKEGGFLFVLFTFHYSSFIIHLSQADFE